MMMNIDSVMRKNGSSRRVNPVEELPLALENSVEGGAQQLIAPQEEWLPITESRKGNIYSCIFHLVCSGIGFQALSLPFAFAHLGWFWGIFTLCIAFVWQLYTTWLLVNLHESPTGARYSRYLQLSIAAFGPKLGKLFVLFPVMYLSGGTCVMLIITGGGTMKTLYGLICEYKNHTCDPHALSATEWFLIFVFLSIFMAQFLPNLHSVCWVSLTGALVAVSLSFLLWILSVTKDRPLGVSYSPSTTSESEADRVIHTLAAIGIIALSFRGHNVLLEIQGTLPANQKIKTKITMWKGVTISYIVIFLCVFPLAICGFWEYGNLIPSGGILNAFAQFHGNAKAMLGVLYFLLTINSLCTFQIFAMPSFDNLELRVTSMTGKRCTRWQRAALRLFFGGITMFIAVTFPFLPKIAALVGGVSLPLTFAYPCLMWIALRKPKAYRSGMWWLNMSLGCLGVLLAVLVVATSIWNLVKNHFHANFFHPK